MLKKISNCKGAGQAELLRLYDFHSSRLKRLRKLWAPLQMAAPLLGLAFCVVGVSISLMTESYGHWLFFSPALCVLIITEIVLDEVDARFLLIVDEHRELLRVARDRAQQPISKYIPTLCSIGYRYSKGMSAAGMIQRGAV